MPDNNNATTPDEGAEDETVAEETQPEATSAVDDKESDDGLVRLWDGEALDGDEAASITCATRTNLVMLAGPPDSGKTTLIASLFHAFQRGAFGGFLFAGSRTLVGFDRRCHLARTASQGIAADTARTRPGEKRTMLHLRLSPESEPGTIHHVLFSDLSGEEYRAAKDSVDYCRRLDILPRADHFVVLVDGRRLTSIESRQAAKNETVMLLRSCVDAEQLTARSLVDVLFAKWDLVERLGEREENIRFAQGIRTRIEGILSGCVGRLRFFEVASRPEFEGFELAHGLTGPLASWVVDRTDLILPPRRPGYPQVTAAEFDRIARVWDVGGPLQ